VHSARGIIVVAGLALFLVGGFLLEGSVRFAPLKQALRQHAVHAGMLNRGSLGDAVKRMGLVRAVPTESSRLEREPGSAAEEKVGPFPKKRQVGRIMYEANSARGEGMPSSDVIGEDDFVEGWPLLSIFVDEDDLYDERTGLLANKRERGKEWERLGYVSYYTDGRLRFASSAGVRVHGGWIRRHPKRHSFRLYMRNGLGAREFPPGVLFGPETQPLKRIVVRNDQPWPFINALSFDVVRRIGGRAPDSQPAIVYLNGESKGIYLLTEHLSQRQWASRVGHDDFAFFRFKNPNDEATLRHHSELDRWVRDPGAAVTLEEAERRIDVESLALYSFASFYLGNEDLVQGAAVLETMDPDARWYWISWDMDMAIRDKTAPRRRPHWEQEGAALMLPDNTAVGVLLRRLASDPGYRRYFVRLAMDALNHRINEEFLTARVDHYERLARAYEPFASKSHDTISLMRSFVMNRADFARRDLQEFYGAGELSTARVKGTPDLAFRIDGQPVRGSYRGVYFAEHPIRVELADADHPPLLHWRVNGRRIPGTRLVHRVTGNTVIEPVFGEAT
jgi:hypothetical protein